MSVGGVVGAAAFVAVVAGAAFVAFVALSDSREARVYRRKWKEFRLKRKGRSTTRYSGTTAGVGASATDKRNG